MGKRICGIVAALVGLIVAGGAAGAATLTATDTVDDATVTLAVEDTFVVGVTTDWCEVRVQVTGADVAFASGDQVRVSVLEDDLVGNDLVFETVFVVTANEVASQLVDRTFDCSTDLSLVEAPPSAEVYAEALVLKAACGTFCADDDPQTATLEVAFVDVTSVGAPEAATWGSVKASYR